MQFRKTYMVFLTHCSNNACEHLAEGLLLSQLDPPPAEVNAPPPAEVLVTQLMNPVSTHSAEVNVAPSADVNVAPPADVNACQ